MISSRSNSRFLHSSRFGGSGTIFKLLKCPSVVPPSWTGAGRRSISFCNLPKASWWFEGWFESWAWGVKTPNCPPRLKELLSSLFCWVVTGTWFRTSGNLDCGGGNGSKALRCCKGCKCGWFSRWGLNWKGSGSRSSCDTRVGWFWWDWEWKRVASWSCCVEKCAIGPSIANKFFAPQILSCFQSCWSGDEEDQLKAARGNFQR